LEHSCTVSAIKKVKSKNGNRIAVWYRKHSVRETTGTGLARGDKHNLSFCASRSSVSNQILLLAQGQNIWPLPKFWAGCAVDIPLIEICNKWLLCNNFSDAFTFLPFFSFKYCESVVLHSIFLEVASKFSRFCEMARRSNLVGPRCSTTLSNNYSSGWFSTTILRLPACTLCAAVSSLLTKSLIQWFPTGGSCTPGVRHKIFGGLKCDFERESLCILGCKNRHLWKVVNAITQKTLSSVIIPARVSNLTS